MVVGVLLRGRELGAQVEVSGPLRKRACQVLRGACPVAVADAADRAQAQDLRVIVADEIRAVDIAIAVVRRQRDLSGPAAAQRGRDGFAGDVLAVGQRRRQGDGTVAEEVVAVGWKGSPRGPAISRALKPLQSTKRSASMRARCSAAGLRCRRSRDA